MTDMPKKIRTTLNRTAPFLATSPTPGNRSLFLRPRHGRHPKPLTKERLSSNAFKRQKRPSERPLRASAFRPFMPMKKSIDLHAFATVVTSSITSSIR